jgi:hypothetical protein
MQTYTLLYANLIVAKSSMHNIIATITILLNILSQHSPLLVLSLGTNDRKRENWNEKDWEMRNERDY